MLACLPGEIICCLDFVVELETLLKQKHEFGFLHGLCAGIFLNTCCGTCLFCDVFLDHISYSALTGSCC